MTISVLRTVDGWWVQTPDGAAKVQTSAATTAELLADRSAIDAVRGAGAEVPVSHLQLLSPVTKPCRVIAQMTNFASHVKDAGMDPKSIPLDIRAEKVSIIGNYAIVVDWSDGHNTGFFPFSAIRELAASVGRDCKAEQCGCRG